MKRGMRTCRRVASRRQQRGLATVEVALSVPALLVILLMTFEFSRVFYQYNTLTKAVRDGSRYLAQNALSGNLLNSVPQGVLTETRNLVMSGNPSGGAALLSGLSANDIDIQFGTIASGGLPRHYVSVTASYHYQPLAPLLKGIGFLSGDIGLDFQLNAASSMRAQ